MDTKRLNYLDSIRGVAACVVLLSHCWEANIATLAGGITVAFHSFAGFIHYTLEKFFAGRAAVMVFFTLSGFVLAYSLEKKPLPYGDYAIKRTFRIYPAFLFIILVSYSLHGFLGAAYQNNDYLNQKVLNPDMSAIALAKHLVFFGTRYGIYLDAVIWSLVHEIRISFLFPLILLSVQKGGWRSVAAWGAFSLACTTLSFHLTGRILDGIDETSFSASLLATGYFIVFFAAGALLAIERQGVASYITHLARWQKAGLFAIVAVCLLKSGHNLESLKGMSSDYANGLGAVGVIALALGVGKFQDMLNHRIPIWLGRVSYSLYLVHMPVLYVASQTFAKGAFTIPTTIIVIILSLLIAECMVRMIELSGIRLGKRLAAEQPVG